MKNHNKPSHLHRERRKGRIQLRHKMQLAQHAGMRSKDPVKITLPKEPWSKDDENADFRDDTANDRKL
jgi:hypothetical protein